MVLHTGIYLQAWSIGIQIANVLSIAVTKASSRESLAVVVDDHRAEDNLVAAVQVDVCYAVVMVSLSLPRAVGIVEPAPALLQLVGLRVYIIGNHLMTGIDAAGQEDARLASIEIGSTEEVLRGTMAVAVAPSLVNISLAAFQKLQRIRQALIGLTRLTVHIYKVLTCSNHKPVGAATRSSTYIGRGITHGICCAIGHVDDRSVTGTHHHLGTAIAVPVVAHNILLVVLEVTHIRAAVHPPQTGAVHLQTLENRVLTLIATLRVAGVHLAQVVKLHQNLQLTIAVNVGTAGIIGNQCTLDTLVLQLDFLIAGAPRANLLALLLLLAVHNCCHGIGAGRRSPLVGIVRHAQWSFVHLHAVTIHIIGNVIILFAEDAPAQVYAAIYLHGHQATIQLVGDALSLHTDSH